MSLDEDSPASSDREAADVSLDYLAEVLRDVLALAPDEGLALVVQTQVARSAPSLELEAAA